MPLVTSLHFFRIHIRLFTDITCDAWHIPRYPKEKALHNCYFDFDLNADELNTVVGTDRYTQCGS